MCERDHGLDDLLVRFVDGHGADETFVDLDLGGRDLLQVGQRRIPLAEVVDREIDAELTQALDARERGRVALDEAVLGQLDRETHLVLVERGLQRFDAREALRVRENLRRHVDGHRERRRDRVPIAELLDDPIEDEPGQRHDGAVALGQRNEIAGRHEVAGFRAPANQRFDAADAIRGDLDLRLAVDLELAARHGALQLGLEFPERRLLLRRVRAIDVVSQLLLARFLERKLGAAEQRRGVVRMRGVNRNAERDVDEKVIAADFELGRVVLGQRNGDVHDLRHRVAIDQDGEAALREADDRRARRQDVAQALRVARAERLALLVAERRRDAIERVELPEQQAREPTLLPLAQELLDEANARALLLAGAAFVLNLGHSRGPSSILLDTGDGNLSRIEQLSL